MCGISGIVDKMDKRVEEQEIKKINDLIKHRGPDDEGFYFSKNFAFGHRRLSIIDLSDAGHQPMQYIGKSGEYIITYNGEIYNYLEIKEELLEYGYTFISNTDTEVILASYDRWGEDCVNRFNGMWAFAIYDIRKNIIFCSRDRFGVKPFYYTEIDNKFIFGSEIKQLLEFYKERYVNTTILIDYLVVGMEEHTDNTFFENIYKLEQSHNLIYDLNLHIFKIEKYFDIEFNREFDNYTELEAIETVKKSLDKAIDLRLRSDVKVGTCLSGGLDSSSIAAIASKKYRDNFIAIHAKSIEKKTDESQFAREVADYCNLNMIEVEPSTEEFINNLEKIVYIQEEPFGSPSVFMQYSVMKKARENNSIVMLDGQGGDETLLGYDKYYALYILDRVKKSPLKFFKIVKEIKENSSLSLLGILFYLFGMTFSSIRLFIHKKEASFIYKKYLKKSNYSYLKEISNSCKDSKKLQYLEIMKTNLPILLRYEDKNSMYCSVETRLPFIDYFSVQQYINLPIKYKIKGGFLKYLLRKAIAEALPSNIVWRKNKFGFESPTDIWLKEMDKNILKKSKILSEISDIDTLLSRFDIMDNKMRWRLYNIALWERVYNVKV